MLALYQGYATWFLKTGVLISQQLSKYPHHGLFQATNTLTIGLQNSKNLTISSYGVSWLQHPLESMQILAGAWLRHEWLLDAENHKPPPFSFTGQLSSNM